MRITSHKQLHSKPVLQTSFVSDYNPSLVTVFGRKVDCASNIPIDQFYALEHNLVNGFIDTSPDILSNPQAASHIVPQSAERPLPAEMSNEQIYQLLVPRKLQSPAELSRLRDLCPKPINFAEPIVESINDTNNE